jgi:hypothetical protein
MKDSDSGVSNLEKSAFWIYGVTAMVMREPFASVLRHASAAGIRDWQVRLELLRVLVVLILMSRLFLASGLYFDIVYMRADSAARFPRRSYPMDFLAGLAQLLIVVGASTIVGLHDRMPGELSLFMALVAVFLISETVWLLLSLALRFSSAPLVSGFAKFNLAVLGICFLAWLAARFGGASPVFGDGLALLLLFAFTAFDIVRLIRKY